MNTTATDRNWTVGELLAWTARYLADKGLESARLDAEILLADVLGCRKIDLYGQRYSDPADEDTRRRYREHIRRRLAGCPTAYLVGKKEFFSLEFEVTPDVLIPRPDSEILVTACLDRLKSLPKPRILDIGTGSGNLAIAIAVHAPQAEIVATDISQAALQVARRNAIRHRVENRIEFLCGDLFEPVAGLRPFDVIVSNPPYIALAELEHLDPSVRDFEPRTALVGGTEGFEVFERIISQADRYVNDSGTLLIEIGCEQEVEARRRLAELRTWELLPTIKDYTGRPRVVGVTKSRAHAAAPMKPASVPSSE